MLHLSTNIIVYHKSDINIVTDLLKQNDITRPIYILEYEKNYEIQFDSEYEFEIQYRLMEYFPDYEFTSDLGKGRKEIKITITTVQHPFSSDNWGRQFNSDSIEKTIYFVKKNKTETTNEPNLKFKVIFGDLEKEYKINIGNGINSKTDEKGFLVLGQPKENGEQSDIIVNELFKDKDSAFRRGFFIMTRDIDKEFDEYIEALRKNRRRKKKKE